VIDDQPRILDFIVKNNVSSLFASMGTSPTEIIAYYTPIVERSLKEHASLLAFIGDDLIGIALNSIQHVRSSSNGSAEKEPETAEVLPSKDYSQGKID
jgi:hypothetical protein